MPYELKNAIKKVTTKPIGFAIVEGKKAKNVVIEPKPNILEEVQEACGAGKVIARGVCLLEGKLLVMKTKDVPKPGWTDLVKKVMSTQKLPTSPVEFRQMGEKESEDGDEGGKKEGSEGGKPPEGTTTTPPPQTRGRSDTMSPPPRMQTPPPKPQGWTGAKPNVEKQTTPNVVIGNKSGTRVEPPVKEGGWKPTQPSVLAQAKIEFEKRFKGIMPRYQKKLTDPEAEKKKEAFFKEAGQKATAKDWKAAHAALDQLEVLVGIASTPEDTNLADGIEEIHRKSGLSRKAVARNTSAAKETATRLVKEDGSFEESAFDTILDEIKDLPDSPHKKQMGKTLAKLKNDPKLREKINEIKKPDPKNPATNFIRASLGLKEDEEVTEAHARQAAIAALTAEMRQNDVGSCFGTSLTIRIHDKQPERFLDDMVQLMTTGKLTRTINGEKIEVPISPKMSTGSVDRKLKLKRTGAKVGENMDLHETPSFGAGLGALGITPEKRKEALDEALVSVRDSKTAKVKAALAKLPNDVDKKTRAKLEREALEALRDNPDADVKTLIGEICKNLNPTQKSAATTACDNYATETEDNLSPEDLLQQVALKRAGLTETDLLLREKMKALGAKVRALQGDTSPQAQKIFDEYSKVADKVTPNIKKFEKLDKELTASREGYLAQEDNRLLRAWEYSVSAMAEKGIAKRQTTRLTNAATKTVNGEVDTIVGNLKKGVSLDVQSKIDEAAPKLKKKFDELFKARIQSGYDASVQGEVSSDGSSDRGAFGLFDTTGASDPADWIKIGSEREYADVVGGLMMEAWLELYGKEKDKELQTQARKIADGLAEAARSTGFIKTATDNTKAEYGGEEQKPWEAVRGNLSENLMQVYYEKDKLPPLAEKEPTGTEDLMKFIIGSTKDMWNGIKDGVANDPEGSSVPLTGGPHAFILRPGSPGLKEAAESGEGATVFATKKILADKKKAQGQRETKLTPSIKQSLYDDLLATYDNKDLWINAVNSRLGPNATVDDLLKGLQDCSADDKGKENWKVQMGYAMTRAIVPPMDPTEVENSIKTILEKLKVPQGKRDAVLNKAKTTATGTPGEVSMGAIEKAVTAALKSEGVNDDENASAKDVNAALRSTMKPPGLVFADSNWGGGDHHTVFSMVTNPVTEELEMWQMNEDGTGSRKMNPDQWVTGKRWAVPTDPTTYGGV